MKILHVVIPILICFNSLVTNWSVASRIKPHKGVCHPIKCDVINDVKIFLAVYGRIYCRKILTLSNQTSRYKRKCIRIDFMILYYEYVGLLSVDLCFNEGTVCSKELSVYAINIRNAIICRD